MTESPPRIAALVLAAGLSRRMGENKLLARVEGRPLVRRVVDRVVVAGLGEVIVVVGHQAGEVRQALDGLPVRFVENSHHALGLSTSLRAGIAALGADVDGALVCLGDMPDIDAGLIARLVAAFAPEEGRAAVAPVRNGRRGHPVLWGRRFFPELLTLSGDVGARELFQRHRGAIAEVTVESDGIFTDLDTPADLAAWRSRSGDLL
ncbi:nucleotidyltransferase family protein [Consotaella salsifontis]|uniref:Molybdenum cofactor cytidylyltransferase n=1 Tax=Consotaella salsifontis TaxID=1365950 RepID=A0A1T4MPM9_9HYPH|nr:nucleotidyltransferase family protein [Consotaella salsifontis]SJZ68999.1 molybdenum cofactor cytidylyltransferase [Consotaella salsifontis]